MSKSRTHRNAFVMNDGDRKYDTPWEREEIRNKHKQTLAFAKARRKRKSKKNEKH